MSNYLAGHAAEQRAARYLVHKGFVIRQLNWKTRWCEIDIVAQKQDCLYFVEVKYRRASSWGQAVEAVTRPKLAKMRFAARCWLAQQPWPGGQCLAVVSITGSTYRFDVL